MWQTFKDVRPTGPSPLGFGLAGLPNRGIKQDAAIATFWENKEIKLTEEP